MDIYIIDSVAVFLPYNSVQGGKFKREYRPLLYTWENPL